MSTVPNLHVDNREADIEQQIIAERVFFGGEEPSQLEREALRQRISLCFVEAIERGQLAVDASMEITAALERLLGPRGRWLQTPSCRLACIEVEDDARDDLRLPLELLRPPTGAEPVLVRCALAETETAPEAPRAYPEGGRIVLATADAGGPIRSDGLVEAMREVCRTGLHLASNSAHDRKRGAFDPALDHLPRASRASLRLALGPRADRPGAAVLQLVCHVREGGLCLHDDDSGEEVLVGAEALAALIGTFAPHLRLVVLVPVAYEPQGDPGRTIIDVAIALHLRGMAAVVAPRVPLPGAALPGMTTALYAALLGDDRVAPSPLELAIVRANEHLSTQNGLAHLGLRLFARAADGVDTRPLVIRPYRGLLSFEPEHARFYVGRKDETTQAVQRLAELHAKGQPRLLLLVGASGVGKSSLAKAGVVPALARKGWSTVLSRPAQHSVEQLETLVEALPAERRLVVVDQLEEVLTDTKSRHQAAKYLQRLWTLATEDGIAVVATLRVDALNLGAEVIVDSEGGHTLEQIAPGPHAIFVRHLHAKVLKQVIAEPARHVGLELDPGLVERLCNEALGEPGALPMLELVLDELWSNREGRQIVAAAYEGGLASRLATYADACVDALPEAQRVQARRILVRIATGPVVELGTWRRRSTVEALRPRPDERRAAFDAALGALVDARLVVRGDLRRAGSNEVDAPEHVAQAVESIELAHELLLRHWDALRRWIEDAAPRLAAIRDLERWVADRREHGTTLLTAEQLVYIEQAKLSAEDDDINGPMVELIEISREAVQSARRIALRWKRLRRIIAATVCLVALAFAKMSHLALAQRDAAREQTQVASEKAALAQERLNHAILLANEITTKTLPKLERHPELREIRKELLEKLQQMLEKLRATETDVEAQLNISAAHIKRGNEALHSDNVDVAHEEYEAAYDIAIRLVRQFPSANAQRELFVCLISLGAVEVRAGNLTAGRDLFRRSLEVAEGLARANPQSGQTQRDLSIALERLGEVEVQMGHIATSRQFFERSLQAREQRAQMNPQSIQARRDIAISLVKLGEVEVKTGNLVAARDIFQRSFDVFDRLAKADPLNAETQRDVSVSLDNLGEVEMKAGRLADARNHFQRSLQTREGLAKADPHNAQAQRDLSVSFDNLGEVAVKDGSLATARELVQRSLRIRESMAEADQHDTQARRDVAVSLDILGELELQDGDLATARHFFQRASGLLERLAQGDPGSAQAQRALSISLGKLGDVEERVGSLAAARDLFRRSLQIAERLASADPHNAEAQHDLSVCLGKLGDMDARAGNLAAARSRFQRALDIAQQLAMADADNAEAQREFSICLDKLGDLELSAGDLAAARHLLERSLKIAERLAKADPSNVQAERELSLSLEMLAAVAVQTGDLTTARDLFQRSIGIAERLARGDPDNAQIKSDLSVSLQELGDLEVQAGRLVAARNLFRRSLVTAESSADADPHSDQAKRDLSSALQKLGNVEMQTGRSTAAREHFQRSLEIAEGLAKADPHSAQAVFDVVLSLRCLAALAEREGDMDALRQAVNAAHQRLEAMEALDQIVGDQERAAVRDFFRRAAEDLAAARYPARRACSHLCASLPRPRPSLE